MLYIDLVVYAVFMMVFFAIVTLINANPVCHFITAGLSVVVLLGVLLHAVLD